MKSITESIIGKRGSQKFLKGMLRPGYIVRYRDDEFGALAMYIDSEVTFPGRPGTIHNIYNAGFYAYSNGNISYMKIDSYEDNLTYNGKYM